MRAHSLLGGQLRHLLKSQCGVTAPIMAISLTAFLGIGLLALNIALTLNTQMKARRIADISVLGAIDQIKQTVLFGDPADLNEADLLDIAEQTFRGHLLNSEIRLNDLTLSYRTAFEEHFVDLNYEVEVTKLVEEIPIVIRDTTSAAIRFDTVLEYLDLKLLLDFSASMSTGATFEDQALMWEHQGCAFACHEDAIEEARDLGIELRQDQLIQALDVLADTAESIASEHGFAGDAHQFSFYTHHNGRTEHLRTTTNFNLVRGTINRLAHLIPSGETGLGEALNTLNRAYQGPPGTGTGPTDRRQFLFLITDGVSSFGRLDFLSTERIGLHQLNTCEQIKDKGTVLGIIHTTYEPYHESMRSVFGNSQPSQHEMHTYSYPEWLYHYNIFVRYPLNNVERRLRNCASPGYYFEASNGVELNHAIASLFNQAVFQADSVPRITS